MTTILQISDTHIVPQGALVSKRLDTAGPLVRLVERVIKIADQIGPIDAVLVSGDLTDDGSKESYNRFNQIMAPLKLPIHVIPGNHDKRAAMRDAFSSQFPSKGPLNWSCSIGDIKLIGLDTLVEEKNYGTLSQESLQYLEHSLTNSGTTPTIVALHHPPFTSGISFLDQIRLTNHKAFEDVLAQASGPLRIVCGHIHNSMTVDFAGHIVISGPSTCSSFAFDRSMDATAGYMIKEEGCLLHRWQNGFQSLRVSTTQGLGPFLF